jgi:hypothetical protein
MKRFTCFIFTFLLSLALFLPISHAYDIELLDVGVDQIIWQADPDFDPTNLSARVDFYAYSTDGDTFYIKLSNTSSLDSPIDYEYPATILLTGIGFNLPGTVVDGNVIPQYAIDNGSISGTLIGGGDPSSHWGFDNYELDSGYYQTAPDGITTLSVNTAVSTMQAAAQDGPLKLFDGVKAKMNGPDYGILSSNYLDGNGDPVGGWPNNYPYFEDHALIQINLDTSIPNGSGDYDWETFFADIDSEDLVVGFGSPTAVVPEPATMLLFGTSLIGLASLRRKFRKR